MSGDTAINNLTVLACGIALAAHTLAASGAELPLGGGADGGGEAGGSGEAGGGEEAGDGAEARQRLQKELGAFLRFLADT